MSDMFLNHASFDLNMLKPETSRFPTVMISEYVGTYSNTFSNGSTTSGKVYT